MHEQNGEAKLDVIFADLDATFLELTITPTAPSPRTTVTQNSLIGYASKYEGFNSTLHQQSKIMLQCIIKNRSERKREFILASTQTVILAAATIAPTPASRD